jgi:hypothetical protein
VRPFGRILPPSEGGRSDLWKGGVKEERAWSGGACPAAARRRFITG